MKKQNSSSFSSTGWLILILLITAIVYSPSLKSSFVYDDHAFIVENPLVIQSGINIWTILTHPFPWKGNSFELYRPFTTLSYRFNTFGRVPNAKEFHDVNLVLHLIVVILFYIWQLKKVT